MPKSSRWPGVGCGSRQPGHWAWLPLHQGLPAPGIPALRTPPGRGRRECSGEPASRGWEPEVQGGAPGNPSPSAPGRCGRTRAGRGGRRAEGGERRGAGRQGGGRRGRPRPRLSEPAPRRRRTRSLCLSPLDGCGAAARAAAGGSASRDLESSARRLPSAPAPLREDGAAALERAPRHRRGHPRARGAAAPTQTHSQPVGLSAGAGGDSPATRRYCRAEGALLAATLGCRGG